MKLLKSSLVGAAALALASVAMATVSSAPHIYITGSSAFRAATMTAIANVMDSGWTYAYDASSYTGCSRAIIYGTLNTTGHAEVTIKCYWSGSAAGVKTVSEGQSLTEWMPDTVTLATGSTTVASNTNVQGTFTKVAAVPQIAMSDTAQGLTPFTANTLETATKVGVVPFVLVKGVLASGHSMKTSFDGLTNINGTLSQVLIGSGIKLAQLSGNSADSGRVYVLGRNPESGTRLTTFAETGYGTANPASAQVQPTTDTGGATASSTTGQTIQDIVYFPNGTVNGIFADDGDNGYSSGGTLADVLSNQVSASAVNDVDSGVSFGLIGYLGTSDASRSIKAVNGNTLTDVSRILSYNGASLNPTYSTGTQAVTWDYSAVREGKYTFWSYEYLMYDSTLTAPATTAANLIAARILSTDATASGVLISSMNCSRQVEGGVVTHN